jgi:putative ABC transport system substrate-binding protein
MAADLVGRKVDVIFANNQSAAALAAKAATATIPIVFRFGADPIKIGLVPSLDRPGGNVTGVTTFSIELNKKKLGILHGLIPNAAAIALLANSDSPTANSVVQELQIAAQGLGRRLLVLWASNEREVEAAFNSIVAQNAGGLYVTPDGFLSVHYRQIAALAIRHKIAAMHETRSFPHAGGLITYGADSLDAIRLSGIYVGRILKGAKPADLPVLQPTTFYFVINIKTANALGITIPDALLIQATELIE